MAIIGLLSIVHSANGEHYEGPPTLSKHWVTSAAGVADLEEVPEVPAARIQLHQERTGRWQGSARGARDSDQVLCI